MLALSSIYLPLLISPCAVSVPALSWCRQLSGSYPVDLAGPTAGLAEPLPRDDMPALSGPTVGRGGVGLWHGVSTDVRARNPGPLLSSIGLRLDKQQTLSVTFLKAQWISP